MASNFFLIKCLALGKIRVIIKTISPKGLAQFYEKQGVSSELISVYSELRKLFEK